MSAKLFTNLRAHQASVSLLPGSYLLDGALDTYASNFARDGYVRLNGLFSDSTLVNLQTEVAQLKKYANTRNFTMPGYETLRRMSTLGGKEVRRQSALLNALYHNTELRSIISRICRRQIFTCHDENEWQVVNWLEGPGDTHGWHLDDPPLALVTFVEAPTAMQGGA